MEEKSHSNTGALTCKITNNVPLNTISVNKPSSLQEKRHVRNKNPSKVQVEGDRVRRREADRPTTTKPKTGTGRFLFPKFCIEVKIIWIYEARHTPHSTEAPKLARPSWEDAKENGQVAPSGLQWHNG